MGRAAGLKTSFALCLTALFSTTRWLANRAREALKAARTASSHQRERSRASSRFSHVRATNQQQECRGGHEHPRGIVKHSQELVFEWPRDQAESTKTIGICFCKLVRKSRKISFGIGRT